MKHCSRCLYHGIQRSRTETPHRALLIPIGSPAAGGVSVRNIQSRSSFRAYQGLSVKSVPVQCPSKTSITEAPCKCKSSKRNKEMSQ